ncbi:MAG: hypothetical protein AAF467_11465 [Actinomycetota bacterium]
MADPALQLEAPADRSVWERLASLVWVSGPVYVARWWFAAGAALTDGQFLIARPVIAAAAPMVAVLVGVGAELSQPAEVFAASWVVVAVLVSIGVCSVQLGLWSWLGYVAADWFTGRELGFGTSIGGSRLVPDSVEALVSAGLEWAVLLLGVVGVPALVARFRLWFVAAGLTSVTSATGVRTMHVVAAVALLHLWLRVVPGAIRSTFAIEGVNFPVEARSIGERHWVIVAIVATVVLVRSVAEARSVGSTLARSVVRTGQNMERWVRQGSQPGRRLGSLAWWACGTLALAPTTGRLWHMLVTGVVVAAAVAVARHGTPVRLFGRSGGVPLVVRLLAGFVIADWMSRTVAQLAVERRLFPDSSLGLLVAVWIAAVVLGVLSIAGTAGRAADSAERAPVS